MSSKLRAFLILSASLIERPFEFTASVTSVQCLSDSLQFRLNRCFIASFSNLTRVGDSGGRLVLELGSRTELKISSFENKWLITLMAHLRGVLPSKSFIRSLPKKIIKDHLIFIKLFN